MATTNKTEYSWTHINEVLFMDLNWSPRAIVRLLFILPSQKKVFTWKQINSALTEQGFRPKQIITILIALKK